MDNAAPFHSRRVLQWPARGGLIVASGLSVGLGGGLIYALIGLGGGPSVGLIGLTLGLLVGLLVGLIGTVLKLQPVEKVRFRWTDVSSRKSVVIRDGLIVGVTGLVVGLIGELNDGLDDLLLMAMTLFVGLLFALLFGLLFGLIVGLTRLFTSEAIPDTRSSVNEGTLRSIKMALLTSPIGGLIGWRIVGVIGESSGLNGGLIVA